MTVRSGAGTDQTAAATCQWLVHQASHLAAKDRQQLPIIHTVQPAVRDCLPGGKETNHTVTEPHGLLACCCTGPAPPPPRLTLQQRFGNRPHPSIAAGQAAYDSYHQQAAQQQQAAAAAAGRQAGEGAAVQEEGEEQEVGGVPPRFYDNGVERVPAQVGGGGLRWVGHHYT